MSVFVAMSGGVDSSVAAALLKEQGYDVHGIFMQTWSPPGISCTSGDDRRMAARTAAHLDIPFVVWDFREEYKRAVVDYMMAEYAAGRTPNPDVMCNSRIKFGVFLERALAAGADFIATGHYIKLKTQNSKVKIIIQNSKSHATCYMLHAARDSNKDQSYFLWTLTQDQLKHCLFPIGGYTKPEVRAMARACGLPNWDKKDSQGLCFVGKVNFSDFLHAYLPRKEGVVLTTSGMQIGTHDGVQFVTIGQRHGLHLNSKEHEARLPAGQAGSMQKKEIRAHYVAERDMATNTVVVVEEDDLLLCRKEIAVNEVNWIAGEPPQLPLHCLARIRYRQPLQKATILCNLPWQDTEYRKRPAHLKVVFDQPQRAVASGQSVVFYTEDGAMIGGGVIA